MKILIVDDEPGAAARLAEGVSAAGIGECLAAQNAEAAVELVNREGAVDVLVTEVFMEGVDGFTLHETLRPHMPALKVVFLSTRELSTESARAEGWPVIAKPVDAGALADFLRDFAAPAPASPEADPLIGMTLGNYRVEGGLGVDRDGPYYRAVQIGIERVAELHALDPARSGDPAEVERFLADARTKANVHHPALLSVFEAGELNGIYFYTSEPRDGASLADVAARGEGLEPRVVLQLLHSVADLMVHLGHEKISHEPIVAGHILLDHRLRTRMVNTATTVECPLSAVQEMRGLASLLGAVLVDSDAAQPVRRLLFDMESESMTLRSWNALLYEVKRCASGAPSPHRLDPSGRAAIHAVGVARKRSRVARRIVVAIVILALLAIGGFFVWKSLRKGGTAESEPLSEPAALHQSRTQNLAAGAGAPTVSVHIPFC